MRHMRYYHPGLFRKRYGRYRLFFFLSFALFLFGVAFQIFWFGFGGGQLVMERVPWEGLFPSFFAKEALLYLAVFLCGITVYAPFFQFAASFLRGFFAGFLLSSVVGSLPQKSLGLLLVLVVLYLLASTSLFCTYSSFCTMVSLRLFTDGSLKHYRLEEKRLFGGSLFNSTFFCNTVNFRFLAMYTLLFLVVLLLCALLAFFYTFCRSFLG